MAKENKKDKIEHLPVCVCEFINRVIKKMRYRRKVQRDVRKELIAHFEDELRNYPADSERDEKAMQLISEFGDVKLLAVLLRRAKKRCRPLWRTVVARSFQGLGILILCFIFYVIWFFTGKPAITTNYVAKLNNLVRPAVEESLNAAPLYEKASRLSNEFSDDFLVFFSQNYHDEERKRELERMKYELEKYISNKDSADVQQLRENVCKDVSAMLRQFSDKKYNELTAEHKIIARRWIQEHNNALDLVVEGSRRPHCWQNYDEKTDMIGISMRHLPKYHRLLFAMQWRIGFRAEQGRFEDALEDIKACYRFGKQNKGDKILIEQLVGIAIEAKTVTTARNIILKYEIDSKTLADFQGDFEKIIADEDFTFSFKAERMTMCDEIQRCFTSDRFGKGHLYLPRFREIADIYDDYYPYPNKGGFEFFFYDIVYSSPFLFTHPNKEQTLASANELFKLWEYTSSRTAARLNTEREAIEEKTNNIIENNPFLNAVSPAFAKIYIITNRAHTEVEATLAITALTRYKQDKGQYPENLDELVTKDYLKKLPMDCFSDKPLVYKNTGDDFLLYSYGPDCTDNDGKPGYDNKGKYQLWSYEDADAIFWPEPEPKTIVPTQQRYYLETSPPER